MSALDLIAKQLAAPITHVVTVTTPDGASYTIDCRSAAAANNEAKAKRRFAGVSAIVRELSNV